MYIIFFLWLLICQMDSTLYPAYDLCDGQLCLFSIFLHESISLVEVIGTSGLWLFGYLRCHSINSIYVVLLCSNFSWLGVTYSVPQIPCIHFGDAVWALKHLPLITSDAGPPMWWVVISNILHLWWQTVISRTRLVILSPSKKVQCCFGNQFRINVYISMTSVYFSMWRWWWSLLMLLDQCWGI